MEIFSLKTTLSGLEGQLRELIETLRGAKIICASEPGPFLIGKPAFNAVQAILPNLWNEEDGKDGRETPILIGAIEASQQALDQARIVNDTKDKLRTQFMELRQHIGSGLSRAGQDRSFRRYLSEIGLGRLSLRQLYRNIPILEEQPQQIRFSYSTKGKSITRLSPQQALAMLDESGMAGPHIDVQRDRLKSLRGDEILARVQHLQGYFKANVRYPSGRVTMPVFLPILYPEGESEVSLPLELKESIHFKAPRKDQEISPEVFIPSLRIYLYQN